MINKKSNILNLLLLSVLLLVSACSDQIDYDGPENKTGTNEVTISVGLSTRGTSTRTYEPETFISNANLIDVLKFAVYEKGKDQEGKETWTIRPEYAKESVAVGNVTVTSGQELKKMTSKEWPVRMRFSFDPDKTYKIAFWAQDSRCGIYDTSDLKEIKIDYEGQENNNESLDAFSKVVDVTVGKNLEVQLDRVTAQINIGTTGADYWNLIYDPWINPRYVTINESYIEVKGVANRFNALTGIATAVDNEGKIMKASTLEAKFNWAKLPAWIVSKVPQFNSDGTIFDEDKNPFVGFDKNFSEIPEEFLCVNLNGKEKLEEYKTTYPTLQYVAEDDGNGNMTIRTQYLTEKFKYLSMCYVMVPTNIDEKGNVTGSIVDIKYNLRQNKGESDTRKIDLSNKSIPNLPVRANFRTNILGGLYHTSDEADPTSIFYYYRMPMIVYDEFLKPDNNSRYNTATFNISRTQASDDGLEITNENGVDIITKDGETQMSEISQTVNFTGKKSQFTFTVKKEYKVEIVSNVLNNDKHRVYTYDSQMIDEDPDPEAKVNWYARKSPTDDDHLSVTLTIYEGSIAGTFNLTISPVPVNKPEEEEEGE